MRSVMPHSLLAVLVVLVVGPGLGSCSDAEGAPAPPPQAAARATAEAPRGLEEPSTVPVPDGGRLVPACESDLVFEASPEVRFDHVGFSVDGGFNWDDRSGAPDWSMDILVGGCNLYDSNLAPPSNKREMAALFFLPSPEEVRALSGSHTLSSGAYLRFEGEQPGDRFGYRAVFAGDIDGADSQRSEVVVSAPRSAKLPGLRGYSERGKVYLFTAGHFEGLGEGDTVRASKACLVLQGEADGDRLGWSLAALDFDGDGIPDLALGAPGCLKDPLYSGRVYVLPGVKLRSLLQQHGTTRLSVTAPALGALVLEGAGASDRFGYALTSVGDLNGDGRDELAVGAPSFQFSAHDSRWIEPHPQLNPPRESIGYVTIHRGRAWPAGARTPPRFKASFMLRGDQAGSQFGAALAGGVDMDGDGLAELVVGAPFHDRAGSAAAAPPLPRAGRAIVYSLSGEATVLAAVDGDTTGHRFGHSVAVFRDVDGDGFGDFALGSPLGGRPITESDDCGPQGGPRCGRVRLYRGPGPGGGAACLLEVHGEAPFDRLGTGLASLGDIDGNGLDDLGFGGQSYPYVPGDDYGRVYVVLR